MSTPISRYNQIADRELLTEFRDALNDQVTTLERQVANLRRDPGDRESIAAPLTRPCWQGCAKAN